MGALVCSLLNHNVSQRLENAESIRSHAVFSTIDWKALEERSCSYRGKALQLRFPRFEPHELGKEECLPDLEGRCVTTKLEIELLQALQGQHKEGGKGAPAEAQTALAGELGQGIRAQRMLESMKGCLGTRVDWSAVGACLDRWWKNYSRARLRELLNRS